MIKATFTKAKQFYEKYDRWFLPATLLIGFIVDVITFKSLQIETTFLLLGAYAILAGASIVYIHGYDGRTEPPKKVVFKWLRLAAPAISSFSFGSLFSSSLLFYWFAGSLTASWPIIIAIAILMVTSEVFKKFYLRETVQVGIFAFTLFSYFSILFPFFLSSLSAWVFLLGGFVSFMVTMILVIALRRWSPTAKTRKRRHYAVIITIFAGMNALYFLNIIPPLPLAIRDAGVYYKVERTADGYTLTGDQETFPASIIPGQTVKAPADGVLYIYAEIFAPAKLTTTIYHRWEYKDPSTNKWVLRARPSYAIRGGRAEGYRGYTKNTHILPGQWRVTVETERGQSLGRIPFTVVE